MYLLLNTFKNTAVDYLKHNISYMLWHIELKFCIWLCFTVLQIKFECRQFALMFVGVMPLLELRILKIHSFPHFSLSCFDILSSNFAYDFVSPYYRSSLSVVNLRQFLWDLCPFWNLEYWKYTVFRTFLCPRHKMAGAYSVTPFRHSVLPSFRPSGFSFRSLSKSYMDIFKWNLVHRFVTRIRRLSSNLGPVE